VTRAAKSFPQSHMAQNRVLMVTRGDGDDADVAIIGASSSSAVELLLAKAMVLPGHQPL